MNASAPCTMTVIELMFNSLPVILLFLFGLTVFAIFTGGIRYHIRRIVGGARDDPEVFILFATMYVTIVVGVPVCLLGYLKCGI